MEKREQFIIQTSFPQACNYLQNVFFPKAKEAGIGAWIQLLSPKIIINEPRCFGMRKILEKNMSLTVQVENTGQDVVVTISSQYVIFRIVVLSIIASIPTCGIAGLTGWLVISVKSNRWKTYLAKASSILRSDLGV